MYCYDTHNHVFPSQQKNIWALMAYRLSAFLVKLKAYIVDKVSLPYKVWISRGQYLELTMALG